MRTPKKERPQVVLAAIEALVACGHNEVTQSQIFERLAGTKGNNWLKTSDGKRAYPALQAVFTELVAANKIVRVGRGRYAIASQ